MIIWRTCFEDLPMLSQFYKPLGTFCTCDKPKDLPEYAFPFDNPSVNLDLELMTIRYKDLDGQQIDFEYLYTSSNLIIPKMIKFDEAVDQLPEYVVEHVVGWYP